jgi:hypothetical protein
MSVIKGLRLGVKAFANEEVGPKWRQTLKKEDSYTMLYSCCIDAVRMLYK